MKNHYKTLGLSQNASADDVRRAYRILARRYHPDVNPGSESKRKFQEILEAYEVLSDERGRKSYQTKLESYLRRNQNKNFEKYQEQAEQSRSSSETAKASETSEQKYKFGSVKPEPQAEVKSSRQDRSSRVKPWTKEAITEKLSAAKNWALDQWYTYVDKDEARGEATDTHEPRRIRKVSIVEASVTLEEAIHGLKKRIEIAEPEGTRQVNVLIPAGVRDGSVIRLRDKQNQGEDLVLIVRLNAHPYLSMKPKGLVVEIPITINEATSGAQISVPGLEDQIMLKVPPGTQSGDELRIKGKGVNNADGTRGDMFVRFLIKTPEFSEAPGLKEKAAEIEKYYGSSVRRDLPRTLPKAAL